MSFCPKIGKYPAYKRNGTGRVPLLPPRVNAAKQFAADWQGKGYEKGHSQTFWLSLLQKVYGVEEPDKFITFEDQIMLDYTSFIDGFIQGFL